MLVFNKVLLVEAGACEDSGTSINPHCDLVDVLNSPHTSGLILEDDRKCFHIRLIRQTDLNDQGLMVESDLAIYNLLLRLDSTVAKIETVFPSSQSIPEIVVVGVPL